MSSFVFKFIETNRETCNVEITALKDDMETIIADICPNVVDQEVLYSYSKSSPGHDKFDMGFWNKILETSYNCSVSDNKTLFFIVFFIENIIMIYLVFNLSDLSPLNYFFFNFN